MFRQCKFYDIENDAYLGGILTDDDDLICGCCGGYIPREEICLLGREQQEEDLYIVTEIYDKWVSLSDEIIGN